MDQSFAQMNGQMNHRFGQVEARFGQIDQRFNIVFVLIVTTWISTIATIFFHH